MCGFPRRELMIDVTGLMDRCRALWHFESAQAVFLQKAGSNRDKPLANRLSQTGADHRYPSQGKPIVLGQVGALLVVGINGSRAADVFGKLRRGKLDAH